MEYMIYRMVETMLWTIAGLLSLPAFVMFYKSLSFYDRKRWVKKQLSDATNEEEKVMWSDKLEAMDSSGFSFPLYQYFKFYLISAGSFLIIGSLVMLLLDFMNPGSIPDILPYLPIVFGGLIFATYLTVYKENRIWKEFGFGSMLIGTAASVVMIFNQLGVKFIGPDTLMLIIGGAATYVFFTTRTFSSAAVALGLSIAIFDYLPGTDVLQWLNYAAIAIPVFLAIEWRKDMKNRRGDDLLDFWFGFLLFFSVMAMANGVSARTGLGPMISCVSLSVLYLYSKATYVKARNIIYRPIELIVSAIVLYFGLMLVFGDAAYAMSLKYTVFTEFSVPKVVAYIIIHGLFYTLYYIFSNWVDEDKVEIDYLVFLLPLFSIFLIWFGDWGSSYIYLIYMVIIGFSYLTKGLDNRNEFLVVIGSHILILAPVIKIVQWFSGVTNVYVLSLVGIIIGSGVIYFAQYLRSQWNVSDADASDS